jgi:tetratricopeptide (TPR) repeat protein
VHRWPSDGAANPLFEGNWVLLDVLMIMGQWERALSENEEALRLDLSVNSSVNLAENYIALNRLDEAKAILDQALAHKLEGGVLRVWMYNLAFARGDSAGMERQVAWAAGKPRDEDFLAATQSATDAYYGRLEKARDASRRAVESALRADARETAATWQAYMALWEAELGNTGEGRQTATASLAIAPGAYNPRVFAALALARAGEIAQVEKLADELAKAYPSDTTINFYWLPVVRASVATSRNNPNQAVELLQPAAYYELGQTGTPLQVGTIYPAYVRGQAFLTALKGGEAAAEFQKIVGHPGIVLNFPLDALAHLGLARAYAMIGDAKKAKAAYSDFSLSGKTPTPTFPS